jgi:hypothetical protein
MCELCLYTGRSSTCPACSGDDDPARAEQEAYEYDLWLEDACCDAYTAGSDDAQALRPSNVRAYADKIAELRNAYDAGYRENWPFPHPDQAPPILDQPWSQENT